MTLALTAVLLHSLSLVAVSLNGSESMSMEEILKASGQLDAQAAGQQKENSTSKNTPIEKVLQMLSDLKANVQQEQKDAYDTYAKQTSLCDNKTSSLSFLIKDQRAQLSELLATIDNEVATLSRLETKMGDLTKEIAKKSRQLTDAQNERKEEYKLYQKEMVEINKVIKTIRHAIQILESSTGASLLQTNNTVNVVEVLTKIAGAEALSFMSSDRVAALLQTTDNDSFGDDDDDKAPGYEARSTGVVETLSDVLDKAEDQKDEAQKSEMTNLFNFKVMEKDLEGALKYAQQQFDGCKADTAAHTQSKTEAEADVVTVKKAIKIDTATLAEVDQKCKDEAAAFTQENKDRQEEIKALSDAKDEVEQKALPMERQDRKRIGEVSFLQEKSKAITHAMVRDNSVYHAAVHEVEKLADEQKSQVLTQLAIRMSNAIRRKGLDPFRKVKGLLSDMISKLMDEKEEQADENAFCESQFESTKKSKDDKQSQLDALQSKLDTALAKHTKMQRELAEINQMIASGEEDFASQTNVRAMVHANYAKQKEMNEKGEEGVKNAMKALREFYGSSEEASPTDVAHSIINLLEIIETDITKTLAALESDEDMAVRDYNEATQQYKIEMTNYQSDAKHKEREVTSLSTTIQEVERDMASLNEELSSVNEFYDKLKQRCLFRADTYKEKIAKMEKELAGLKRALALLKNAPGATSLVQGSRQLRGSSRH